MLTYYFVFVYHYLLQYSTVQYSTVQYSTVYMYYSAVYMYYSTVHVHETESGIHSDYWLLVMLLLSCGYFPLHNITCSNNVQSIS